MNDFERRLLDTAQTSVYVAEFIKNTPNVLAVDPFSYCTDPAGPLTGLAPAGEAQEIVPIQADSDFLMFYMSGSGVLSNAGTPVLTTQPPGLIQFTDTGSGKDYYSQPTQFSNVIGAAGYPFILPLPRLIPSSTSIKVDIANTSATDTIDYFVTFLGVRIYRAL